MERRSLMVILAHPDDESFPMGGTLAAYAARGATITLVTATSGQQGIPGLAAPQAAAVRDAELHAAAAALGIAEVRTLGYMDGALEQAPQDEEAENLACHEYFTLARPSVLTDALACLFAPLPTAIPA